MLTARLQHAAGILNAIETAYVVLHSQETVNDDYVRLRAHDLCHSRYVVTKLWRQDAKVNCSPCFIKVQCKIRSLCEHAEHSL